MVKIYPKNRNDWMKFKANISKSELTIGNWQVMQDWEKPLMEVMAKGITRKSGDILEVGFGMGISAETIINSGCKSYTVIEAHPDVVKYAKYWADQISIPVNIIEGFWEDVLPTFNQKFDGILFDTYPLKKEERGKNHYPFIKIAPDILKKGGVLTYYSDEVIPFRKDHLVLLQTYFDEITLLKVENLKPGADCEYWNENYMIVPFAKKLYE